MLLPLLLLGELGISERKGMSYACYSMEEARTRQVYILIITALIVICPI